MKYLNECPDKRRVITKHFTRIPQVVAFFAKKAQKLNQLASLVNATLYFSPSNLAVSCN
jgi:hypothetical protein